jgi:thiol-disulfide isomerase/thioredoxin
MMKQSSAYLPYTAQALSQTAGNRRVLFFYASWCPTCIPADAEFAANLGKIPSDVSVIRVNYNDPETDAEEKALAQKYAVTYQHTYVQIDEAGNKVKVWNGGAVDELLANIK